MDKVVELVAVEETEFDEYIDRLQRAFSDSDDSDEENGDVFPPRCEIEELLRSQDADSMQIVCDGHNVGGAIVKPRDDAMMLDYLFIDVQFQNRHLGQAAWKAIEQKYPHVSRWVLITPYDERRNIHFYVNRCGFDIVAYYNDRNPEPNRPEWVENNDADHGTFLFAKEMK